MSNSLDDLFAQLRHHHPTAALTTALLCHEGGTYVVKASITLETGGSLTAMAAAAQVEAAEDRACQRALARIFGATPADALPQASAVVEHSAGEHSTHVVPAQGGGVAPAAPLAPTAALDVAPSAAPAAAVAPASMAAVPEVPAPAAPNSTVAPLPPMSAASTWVPESPPEAPLPEGTPQIPASPPIAATPASATGAPVDLSDIIAQTDVELRRLGWGINEGRTHLEHTYGKRSRHDLTDEELLEFLLHLESQPTPSPTP